MRKTILLLMVGLLFTAPAQVHAAEAEDVIYSVLFPGLGQFRSGRNTRGTIFMGVEMLAIWGLGVTNIQYDREVESYENAKALYESSTYIGDAKFYYDQMVDSWESADDLHGYRKLLAGAAIGIWAVNVADMLWGPEAGTPPLSLEVRQDGFMVCKTFSF